MQSSAKNPTAFMRGGVKKAYKFLVEVSRAVIDEWILFLLALLALILALVGFALN